MARTLKWVCLIIPHCKKVGKRDTKVNDKDRKESGGLSALELQRHKLCIVMHLWSEIKWIFNCSAEFSVALSNLQVSLKQWFSAFLGPGPG